MIDVSVQHLFNVLGESVGMTATVTMPDGGRYETPVFDTADEAEAHADTIYRVVEEWWNDGG